MVYESVTFEHSLGVLCTDFKRGGEIVELFLQQFFNGLTLGSIYILVAIGLTLVFGILHIPDFAHGSLYLIGGYITLMVVKGTGVHYFVAIIVSIFVVALLGVLMERLVFNQLRSSPPIHDNIAALWISVIFRSIRPARLGNRISSNVDAI